MRERSNMVTDPLDILRSWIVAANEGRLKDGTRELTNNECALVGNVLRCIAGDLSVANAPLPESMTRKRRKVMSDGQQPEKDFKRAEGVYCEWITYPPGFKKIPNLLQIERVNGDCSVTRMTVTRDEADVIAEAIGAQP
jgi:hypothetical protein